MSRISGIDHVAITVSDLERTCVFYDGLFGSVTHAEYAPDGAVLVRQLLLGGALLSVHQAGNGVDLVAHRPTPGAADLCLRWSDDIESAIALLDERGIEIIEGPTPRRTSDGLPSHSIFFRDPDANLIEIMAADRAPTGGTRDQQ